MTRKVMIMVVVAALALGLSACTPRERTYERRDASGVSFAKGRVQAPVPLRIRGKSTRKARVHGYYRSGSIVRIRCKVRGQQVHGNRTWYRLSRGYSRKYVSGHYVRIGRGRVPFC